MRLYTASEWRRGCRRDRARRIAFIAVAVVLTAIAVAVLP